MENKEKKKVNKWIVFTSMPFQMGITIYLFHWVGKWLDKTLRVEGEWWMKCCTLLGVVVSLYYFIKQANYISKK
ncbi:AtpZ/AtpI family protein [Pedobacter helvus]|uniref:AtpZ/AtpI family protein n=1 Tax=Pedobacter helvus TaxID=2563444 RepID=A0ABW9JHU9_9SPHI|nr:AtpZ/AtpI family protein [Pedobacter ureilyticus]